MAHAPPAGVALRGWWTPVSANGFRRERPLGRAPRTAYCIETTENTSTAATQARGSGRVPGEGEDRSLECSLQSWPGRRGPRFFQISAHFRAFPSIFDLPGLRERTAKLVKAKSSPRHPARSGVTTKAIYPHVTMVQRQIVAGQGATVIKIDSRGCALINSRVVS